MACRSDPPSPLLVRVSPSGPRLHRKLELYFQSRSSGGGECTVRPHDRPDTFLVRFQARADKERVLKKKNHNFPLDDKIVKIYLKPTENPTETNTRLRNSSLTQVREEQRSDEKHLNEEYIPDTVASCVQKIFLDVTADLNCDLFSKEQRNHISTLCPNIKKMEGSKGIEKVCGDFRDIEKIYHYLSKQLLDNELKCGSSTFLEERQSLHPPSWNSSVNLLERQLHHPSSSKNNVSLLPERQLLTPSELQNRSEEKNMHCEIPLLFFEYFKYVSPNKLESIERKFGIKIKIQECSPCVRLDFIKNQSNNCSLALDFFASEFQKVTTALKEEHIILPDNEKPHKIKQKLVHQFEKLLIKENQKGLTLIGTQDDITAAKQFLASPTPESLTKGSLKIPPPEYMMNGIGVDTAQYKLLRIELCQKISEIEKTYHSQSRVLEGNQKTYIIFEPLKELDLSVQACINFINAYQNISSQLTREILLLKSLGKKKKHWQSKKFSDNFRKNHPNVHFVSNQETVTLIGLPGLLEKAKQYVLQEEMSLLNREKWSGDCQTTMDVDSNNSKIAPPTFQHSASAGNTGMEENKNKCVICLDTIRNKKVLPKCKHEFCNDCISKAMKYSQFCPLCKNTCGILRGNQPKGTMNVSFLNSPPTFQHSTSAGNTGMDKNKNKCVICLDTIHNKKVLPKCKHEFCNDCISKAMKYSPFCPLCKTPYGILIGNQPKGTMNVSFLKSSSLPGYEQHGTIIITYKMEGGIQTEKHPNPGMRYPGVEQKAYLPDNEEGKEVLNLLRRAFDQKLIFTVGISRTTGASNVITWNDIHHKTATSGGPANYGYPDPDYLKRVKQELKNKGIE